MGIEFCELIKLFFTKIESSSDIEVYNEFSLQHELGVFLRNQLPRYKVQFERNVSYFNINSSTIKKEMDIVVFDTDRTEIYAIELKYPRNGQYPEQLYSFTKDLVFAEELKREGFTKAYVVTLVSDMNFCRGANTKGIYGYYRNSQILSGRIFRPTGKTKDTEFINVSGTYQINWKDCVERKYYILEAQ